MGITSVRMMKTPGAITTVAVFLILFSNAIQAQTGTQAERLMNALLAYDHKSALALAQVIDAADYANRSGGTLLMVAAKNGYLDICTILLDKGAKVDAQASDGTTALWVACQSGQLGVVILLLDHGATIELKRTKDGKTPLMAASSASSGLPEKMRRLFVETVKLLLDRGAKIDLQDAVGQTALFRAWEPEIVTVLLERGANREIKDNHGKTALDQAASLYQKDKIYLLENVKVDDAVPAQAEKLMKALLANDLAGSLASVQHIESVDYMDNRGNSLLIEAARNGYFDVCRKLLEQGAKSDWQAIDGLTALVIASQLGHAEVVKLLLEKGASVDLRTNKWETALFLASQKGHTEIVKSLLAKGASVDLAGSFLEWTPLIIASQEGHHEIVRMLLEKGAKLDFQIKGGNNNGETALMRASENGHAEIVKLLLESGANPDLKNSYLSSTRVQKVEGSTMLSSVEIRTMRGNTALMLATKRGHLEIVKLLLEKGANPDIKDDTGKRALDYATNNEMRVLLTAHIKK